MEAGAESITGDKISHLPITYIGGKLLRKAGIKGEILHIAIGMCSSMTLKMIRHRLWCPEAYYVLYHCCVILSASTTFVGWWSQNTEHMYWLSDNAQFKITTNGKDDSKNYFESFWLQPQKDISTKHKFPDTKAKYLNNWITSPKHCFIIFKYCALENLIIPNQLSTVTNNKACTLYTVLNQNAMHVHAYYNNKPPDLDTRAPV